MNWLDGTVGICVNNQDFEIPLVWEFVKTESLQFAVELKEMDAEVMIMVKTS